MALILLQARDEIGDDDDDKHEDYSPRWITKFRLSTQNAHLLFYRSNPRPQRL